LIKIIFECEQTNRKRELLNDVTYLAVYASAGQGTLHIAPEKSPPGTFAVVIVKPRKGGEGLKYTVLMSVMPKLNQINSTIPDPLGRYDAVMAIPVESFK
jgi:hypothetical protein